VEERPSVPLAGAALATSPALIPPHNQIVTPKAALLDFLPLSANEDDPLPPEYGSLLAQDEELREVTVLCSGLAHTEALTTRLTPEALHHLICGFFEQAWQGVQRSGGLIHGFLDDSFLALFGVSGSYEDHPRQALQAVAWLQQRLRMQGRVLGMPEKEEVVGRLGMHTGSVS
jgi:class 3 adenylate cyclase